MPMAFPSTGTRGDTKLRKWAKILGTLQNAAGALTANDPKRGDTWRITKAKILRSLQGSSGGDPGGGTPTQPLTASHLTDDQGVRITDDQGNETVINL